MRSEVQTKVKHIRFLNKFDFRMLEQTAMVHEYTVDHIKFLVTSRKLLPSPILMVLIWKQFAVSICFLPYLEVVGWSQFEYFILNSIHFDFHTGSTWSLTSESSSLLISTQVSIYALGGCNVFLRFVFCNRAQPFLLVLSLPICSSKADQHRADHFSKRQKEFYRIPMQMHIHNRNLNLEHVTLAPSLCPMCKMGYSTY